MRISRIELPPSSKKLSSRPTCGSSSSSCQVSAMARSAALAGASYSACCSAAIDGAGSALRSTLPLALSGIASSITIAAGTM
ncbi:hypothetical protein D3C71_2049440 [compost metagenome]